MMHVLLSLIATRHEAIDAYLGRDYGGFVRHSEAGAMHSALLRALQDAAFRITLSNQIRQAKQHMARSSGPGGRNRAVSVVKMKKACGTPQAFQGRHCMSVPA